MCHYLSWSFTKLTLIGNEFVFQASPSEGVSRLLIGPNRGKALELIALPELAKAHSSKHPGHNLWLLELKPVLGKLDLFEKLEEKFQGQEENDKEKKEAKMKRKMMMKQLKMLTKNSVMMGITIR